MELQNGKTNVESQPVREMLQRLPKASLITYP